MINEKSNLPAVVPVEKLRSSLSMKMLNANRQIEENRILGENYKIATRIGNVQSSLSKELISEDLEKFKTIKSKQHEELKKDPAISTLSNKAELHQSELPQDFINRVYRCEGLRDVTGR